MINHCLAATLAALILSSAPATAALPNASAPKAGNRPQLELKGIKLGDDLATVKAALPQATCETLADPLLGECWQPEGATLGGKPAQILVRLLDGKVVSVMALHMTQDDAYDVIEALKVKFGNPDVDAPRKVVLVRPERTTRPIYTIYGWIEDGGNHDLNIDPDNWTDTRRDFTYAAITLTDHNAHNNQWMPRFNGTANTTDL